MTRLPKLLCPSRSTDIPALRRLSVRRVRALAASSRDPLILRSATNAMVPLAVCDQCWLVHPWAESIQLRRRERRTIVVFDRRTLLSNLAGDRAVHGPRRACPHLRRTRDQRHRRALPCMGFSASRCDALVSDAAALGWPRNRRVHRNSAWSTPLSSAVSSYGGDRIDISAELPSDRKGVMGTQPHHGNRWHLRGRSDIWYNDGSCP